MEATMFLKWFFPGNSLWDRRSEIELVTERTMGPRRGLVPGIISGSGTGVQRYRDLTLPYKRWLPANISTVLLANLLALQCLFILIKVALVLAHWFSHTKGVLLFKNIRSLSSFSYCRRVLGLNAVSTVATSFPWVTAMLGITPQMAMIPTKKN